MARISDPELLRRLSQSQHAEELEALLDLYEARQENARLRDALDRTLDLLEEVVSRVEGAAGVPLRRTPRREGEDI
jgi:hypothetical protein